MGYPDPVEKDLFVFYRQEEQIDSIELFLESEVAEKIKDIESNYFYHRFEAVEVHDIMANFADYENKWEEFACGIMDAILGNNCLIREFLKKAVTWEIQKEFYKEHGGMRV